MSSPSATVIVTTYENPRALALVLAGLARQTSRAFEVLVADDGSGPQTRDLLERATGGARPRVRHLWQPDEGLRKSRILNRAIRAAAGEVLVFLDGDCIPGPRFVERHLACTTPGAYLSGSCVLLGEAASLTLVPDAVARGALDGFRSFRPGNRRARRLVAGAVPKLARFLDEQCARHPVGFHGGNASVARSAAVEIGGFDERFERFEDKDFGARLRRNGLRGLSVRYRIPTWHVHHERPYVEPSMRDAGRALFAENEAAKVVHTPYGLDRDAGTMTE